MAKNTYNISFGGKKETLTGVNIESALTEYGFTDINIIPLWRGKSNGKYEAHCSNNTVVSIEWVEKINELKIDGLFKECKTRYGSTLEKLKD